VTAQTWPIGVRKYGVPGMRSLQSVAVMIAACAATLLSLAAQAATLTTMYSFTGGIDGANPQTALLYADGVLYGTTANGGQAPPGSPSCGCGTVFKIDPKIGTETIVYTFKGGSDGSNPQGALIELNGLLYGTTYNGGTEYEYGTVYKLDPKTGAESVLYAFTGASDGANPHAGLTNVNGILYGTTEFGGDASPFGSVFKIDPTTGVETTLHEFGYSSSGPVEAAYPEDALVYLNGVLYGTTFQGGTTCDCGTVFEMNPTTGALAVLHSFASCSDGTYPITGLINVSGTLYGTTGSGGKDCSGPFSGNGTVFGINPSTGKEMVLYRFNGTFGAHPSTALLNVGGTLIGPTFDGGQDCGSYGCGTLFAIGVNTRSETSLYAFSGGNEGANPQGALISVGGVLYGTTYDGGGTDCGGSGCGTVYKLTK
jgi:uncharacterized repeat protein (TIGR03803 family)